MTIFKVDQDLIFSKGGKNLGINNWGNFYTDWTISNRFSNFELLKHGDTQNNPGGLQHRYHLDIIFQAIIASLNPELGKIVREHCFFAGGCIRSLETNQKINDYDLYFTSNDAFETFQQELNKIVKENKTYFSDKKTFTLDCSKSGFDYSTGYFTENALTFKLKIPSEKIETTVQFIKKFTGAPTVVIENFDFTNSMAYYYPAKGAYYTHPLFDISVIENRLYFNKDCYSPINSLNRLIKFTKLGYKISNTEILKIMEYALKDTEENVKKFKEKGGIY